MTPTTKRPQAAAMPPPPEGDEKTWGGAAPSREQRRKNLRLGLVLATVAIAFLLGFVAKAILFGA